MNKAILFFFFILIDPLISQKAFVTWKFQSYVKRRFLCYKQGMKDIEALKSFAMTKASWYFTTFLTMH